MADEPVQDSEEFLVFPARPHANPPRLEIRMNRRRVIVEAIAKSDLGWTGFLIVAPLVLGVLVLVVTLSCWILFIPIEVCPRCGHHLHDASPDPNEDKRKLPEAAK